MMYLWFQVKPKEINSIEFDSLCRRIQETLFAFPSNTSSILGDLEICIGGSSTFSSNNLSEVSLTREMIILVARMLGNEESILTLVSSNPITDGVFGEQLSEQIIRDGIAKLLFQFIFSHIASYSYILLGFDFSWKFVYVLLSKSGFVLLFWC